MIVHVVEDDEFLRGSLARLLAAAGYLVETWAEADPAVEAIRRSDLVPVVVANGLRDSSGRDLLDAIMEAGAVAAAVRFSCAAEGPAHTLEIERLRKPANAADVLRAVARAADAAWRINAGLAGAGLLGGRDVAK